MSLFGGDKEKKAAQFLEQGKFDKAAKMFAKAGRYLEAARASTKGGDQKTALFHYAQAVLGPDATGFRDTDPGKIAGLLVAGGHLADGLEIYESAGQFAKAAEFSLRTKDVARAARNYERAQDWDNAARYYERQGRLHEATKMLERESLRLAGERSKTTLSDVDDKQRDIDWRRAQLLAKLDKREDAAAAVTAWPAETLAEVQLLEEVGGFKETVESYLRIDRPEDAYRVLRRMRAPDPDLAARVYTRVGRHNEAAALHTEHGADAAAAEALEMAGSWDEAARSWEDLAEYQRAARCYERSGRSRDAARCWAAARQYAVAAKLYKKVGDHREAATCLLQARDRFGAGQELLAAGAEEDATRVLEQIPQGDRTYPEAVLSLAPLMIAKSDRAEEALKRINSVSLEIRGDQPEWLYWEARALEALGRAEDAHERYSRLLGTRSDYRDTVDRLGILKNATLQQPTVRQAASAPPAAAGPAMVGAPVVRLTAEQLPTGALLAGRYELGEPIGRGGMGQVYKAYDRELREHVAIKTLLSGPGGASDEERLIREVQICRRITHPNVVRVHDLGRVEGGLFITMELLEGVSLEEALRTRPRPTLAQTKVILMQIVAGLDAAHRLEVVHRDLKPGNVMVLERKVMILDFGIARMHGVGATITQTGVAVGSPVYMSPEQLKLGDLDARSDLYSLGVLAFRMLAGSEPFTGGNLAALAHAHIHSPPPRLGDLVPEIPEAWESFVQQLLAKEPADRLGSAREVFAALKSLPG